MADYRDAVKLTEESKERVIKNTLLLWTIRGGGIVYTTSGQRYTQRLSNINEVSNPTAERVGERTLQTVGDCQIETYDSINNSVTLTIQADAVSVLQALCGRDEHTYRAVEVDTYTKVGDLVILSTDDIFNEKVATILTACDVKITEVAGLQGQGTAYSVELISRDSKMFKVRDAMFSHEVFWDASPAQPTGAGVTQAPDGLRTTFDLGAGNYSYSSPPTAGTINVLDVRPDLTGLYKTLLWIEKDGVAVTDDEASISGGVITFTTAPAAGSKLEVCYIVDGNGTGDTYTPAMKVAGGRNMADLWQTFQQE